MLYQNILETIGQTPLVKINRLVKKPGVEIWSKLESFNPGGSIKDRVALKMLLSAIREKKLSRGQTILEPTSGNTGIGLALAGAVLGYPVRIIMSAAVSEERRKIIRAFGAGIILTDPKKGTDGAIIRARKMVEKDPKKYFMPDQFSNQNNRLAHYENTAREIWKDMDGRLDFLVSSIGTSGTIMGVGQYLKRKNPKIEIVCAYPEKGHYIQGLKNMEEALVPRLYDPKKIDRFITVESERAFAMARRLAKQEGILGGMSSGAAMLAALELAKKIRRGKIVVILPDGGEKYLSTQLYA